MEVPVVVINAVLFGVFALVGIIFRFAIMGRIDKVESGLSARMASVETNVQNYFSTLNETIRLQSLKGDAGIEKIVSGFTPRSHCDAKQELWQLKFDSIQAESKKEHAVIEKTLAGLIDAISERLPKTKD